MSPRRQQLTLEAESAPVSRETSAASQTLVQLSLERVDPSPLNPRKHFDPVALDELTASMQVDGQIQPIVVRPIGAGEDMRFSIVSGERRYRAAQRLRWRTIGAIIRPELNEQTHARISLLENLTRSDLDPEEEARGYQQLVQLGMTQEQVADAVNRSRPAVANALRLLKAPTAVLAKMHERGDDGKPLLSPSHVLPLLRYEAFPDVVIRLAEVAADWHTPSKDLEKGFPGLGYEFTQALTDSKLAAEIVSYRAEFDIEKVCGACPFGAFVEGKYTSYCLKPEHFRQLQKEARAAQKAEVAAAVESASTDGATVLQLRSLRGQYQLLDYGVPKGCTPKCECRAIAVDGARQVKVCTKPTRFRQLQDEQRRKEEADRKQRMKDLADRCGRVLDTVTEVGSRELALVAVHACARVDAKRLKALLERHAPNTRNRPTSTADVANFATLQPLSLLKIAVEAVLGDSIDALRYRSEAKLADWYAGPAPKPARTEKPSRRGKPKTERTFDAEARLAEEIASEQQRLEQEYALAQLVGVVE